MSDASEQTTTSTYGSNQMNRLAIIFHSAQPGCRCSLILDTLWSTP
jgi:hypothetical protein